MFNHPLLHQMLMEIYVDNPSEKHRNMYEGLSGMGVVADSDVRDFLSRYQAISVVVEYVSRLYKGEPIVEVS